MFCRFCGSNIIDDSIFCAKCGKRLRGSKDHPRLEKISARLYLRTPYPYAAILILLATLWVVLIPNAAPVDYSHLQWTLKQDRNLDLSASNLYQQGFSLVLENVGSQAVREIPVEFHARVEPPQPAEIATTFRGTRFPIMIDGKPLPLVVVLSDEVRPGSKRSFLIEGSIQAMPPFKVTYEIREEGSDKVLADFVVAR
jgi:hypothetical protein